MANTAMEDLYDYDPLFYRYEVQSISHLLLGEISLLDANIGDRQGALRAPILKVMYRMLSNPETWRDRPVLEPGNIRRIVNEHLAAHVNDIPDRHVADVEQALGAEDTPEFEQMIQYARDKLSPGMIAFITLSHWFEMQKTYVFAECGLALCDPMPPARTSSDHARRVQLQQLTDTFFFTFFRSACGMTETTSVLSPDVADVARELLEAYPRMCSGINGPEAGDTPMTVRPLYNIVRAISFVEFDTKGTLVIKVFREKVVSTQTGDNFRHSSAPIFIFDFDQEDGKWVGTHVDGEEDDYIAKGVTVYECYSSVRPGVRRDGLEAADDREFNTAMTQVDPYWLLMVWAASRAAYPLTARDTDAGYDAHYGNLRTTNRETNAITSRDICTGFSTDPFNPSPSAPDLWQEWNLAAAQARNDGLDLRSGYFDPPDANGVMRRCVPVPLLVCNSYPSTLKQVVADSATQMGKYRMAVQAGAVVGGYAIRVGKHIYSFESYDNAVAVNAMASMAEKRRAYLDLYPGNVNFII